MSSNTTDTNVMADLLAGFEQARRPDAPVRRRYRVVSPFADTTEEATATADVGSDEQ